MAENVFTSVDLNAVTTPYVYRPYPRMLYRNGATCVVQDEAAQVTKEADGWGRAPNHAHPPNDQGTPAAAQAPAVVRPRRPGRPRKE